VYGALRALDALTGETTLDDILHQSFPPFALTRDAWHLQRRFRILQGRSASNILGLGAGCEA
jgi:ABC-type transporter lipoprotein component MlaA